MAPGGLPLAYGAETEADSWGTHTGAEIDLVVQLAGHLVGVEIKRTDAPRMSPSIRSAIGDLDLARVVVAHAGSRRYRLGENIEAVGVADLLTNGLGE